LANSSVICVSAKSKSVGIVHLLSVHRGLRASGRVLRRGSGALVPEPSRWLSHQFRQSDQVVCGAAEDNDQLKNPSQTGTYFNKLLARR
jgi:hypothetical protein